MSVTTGTRPARPPVRIGRVELIALLATSMAMAALGIDLMLPAFGSIRQTLGLPADSTAVSGLVTAYFIGLALGQLAYGPLSDRFGRKPVLFVGLAVYAAGALASTVAPSLPLLLAGRVVWGLGAASPRVITIAVVRDQFEGEAMSRVMSFIMAVFLLAPVMSPSLGAAVVSVVSWRWLFLGCAVAVAAVALWARRLPETLHPEHRLPLRWRRVGRAAREVVSHRQTVAYMLAMTALYGAFISYLGSSEIIITEVYDRADAFPYIFGGIAAVMGVSMLLNARVVERVGTRRLAHGVLLVYVAVASLLVVGAVSTGGRPPLVPSLLGAAAVMASHGLLIPNLNTIAMQPMGAIAGTASSVIGAVQIAVGALLGAVIDAAFDGSVVPMAVGFLAGGVVALGLVTWGEGGVLFRPLVRTAPQPPVVEPAPTP